MIHRLKAFTGIIILRGIPGVVNLFSLLYVSKQLSIQDFGYYSTLLVTLNLVASIIYGPLRFSMVSRYSKLEAAGDHKTYESTVLLVLVLISLAMALLSAISLLLVNQLWLESLFIVSAGAMLTIQEILRVQLRHKYYAQAALLQSTLYFLLCALFLESSASPTEPILLMSMSYFVAAGLSLMHAKIDLRRPNFGMLSNVRDIGFPYLLSTLAENGLLLGFRYVLLGFGTATQLGVFSFCVDLAQRTVGFVVSVAGFLFIPHAFRSLESEGRREFARELILSALLAGTLAIIGLLGMLLVLQNEIVAGKYLESFHAPTFAIVGIAVIINRVKKIIADPVAMMLSRVNALSLCYIVGAAVTLPLAVMSLVMSEYALVKYLYLSGYMVVTILSCYSVGVIWREVRN